MITFKDTEAREWSLRIDVNAIRRVRSTHGVDLANVLGDKETLVKLSNDPCLLVDVIHCLCLDQCTARGVTPEQFGAALAGDAIEAAANAFQEAIIEFLPPSKRRLMRQMLDGQKASQAQAELRIQVAIEKGLITNLIAEEMAALDKILQTASGTSLRT